MIRRVAILLIVAAWYLSPSVAYAEAIIWVAPDPKQGTSGFLRCVGTATAAGTTYVNINWVDDMEEPVDACNRFAREDVANFFRYARGVEISPESVQVTYERMP